MTARLAFLACFSCSVAGQRMQVDKVNPVAIVTKVLHVHISPAVHAQNQGQG